MSTDETRPVVGYEGRYAVTRDGRVWAYPNVSRLKGRWLKVHTMRSGYLYVPLFNGKRKNVYVHRIVAMAWLPASDKPQVNHIDGNRANNHVDNLEWVTHSENKLHAFRTGLTYISKEQMARVRACRRAA